MKTAVICAVVFVLVTLAIQLHFKNRLAGMTMRVRMDAVTTSGAVATYRSETGENLHGENALMFQSLLGSNTVKTVFLSPTKMNERAESLDSWGTPYQLSFVHVTNLLVHSAGRNRMFGDADDLIFDSSRTNFIKQPK